MAASERGYHHSVRHYHSPFKLEHRNASAFPDTRSPHQREEDARRVRQEEVSRSFYRHPNDDSHAVGQQGFDSPRRAGKRMFTAPAAVPGMMPNVSNCAASGDHMFGGSMSPSRAPVPMPADATNVTVHPEGRVLSRDESNVAWLEHKSMRFGVHRTKREPYVSRDEFVDPLRCTSPTNRVASGFATHALNQRTRSGGKAIEYAMGYRRTPAHAVELPEKVNWHDPTRPPATSHSASSVHSSGSSSAGAATMRRLPATPLLAEVEERLRLHGMGSLIDIHLASDEAITAVLRDCSFTPTQCMTILWELRKRYPRSGAMEL